MIFGRIYRQRNLTERLPEINVKKQNLLGGMMHCSHLTSLADPGTAMGQARNGKPYFAEATLFRGKDVTRLEIQKAPIICGQQGAKRHRDENIVPTPRQVVTRCIGGLFSADIAVQHRAGNRWQWHRKKSNRSATVRTEESAAKRPA